MSSFARTIGRNILHDDRRMAKAAAQLEQATLDWAEMYQKMGQPAFFIRAEPGVVFMAPWTFEPPEDEDWKLVFLPDGPNGKLREVTKRGKLTPIKHPWPNWTGELTIRAVSVLREGEEPVLDATAQTAEEALRQTAEHIENHPPFTATVESVANEGVDNPDSSKPVVDGAV